MNDARGMACMLGRGFAPDSEHKCAELAEMAGCLASYNDAVVLADGNWYYVRESYSTDEDVNRGEALRAGELIYGEALLIRFCPFCGEKLN